MLTKDQIRKNLTDNPDWEPDDDSPILEWDYYYEVSEELDKDSHPSSDSDDDTKDKSSEDFLSDGDDDDSWDDEDTL